jgi:hypothetical protein
MYVEAYNAALGLEFFRRVTTPRTHAEAKELAEALCSWEAFGEALWRAYGDPSYAGTDTSSTDG